MSDSPLEEGRFVHVDDLAAVVEAALQLYDGPRYKLGEELGRTAAEISNAAGAMDRPQIQARTEILEATAGLSLAGPFYKVVRKAEAQRRRHEGFESGQKWGVRREK